MSGTITSNDWLLLGAACLVALVIGFVGSFLKAGDKGAGEVLRGLGYALIVIIVVVLVSLKGWISGTAQLVATFVFPAWYIGAVTGAVTGLIRERMR